MSLAGQAALAMWWDMAPDRRTEFEHWHTHEHFPERLAIPGFLRASRWAAADGTDGFFVLYELRDRDVLGSPAYLARLNAPTPWSTRLMPHHRNMVRSQCRVVESRGGVIAAALLTVRFATAPAGAPDLQRAIAEQAARLVHEPGLVGIHLLHHEPPALAAPTEEQRIRGLADAAADWVLLLTGYDAGLLGQVSHEVFGGPQLAALGAQEPVVRGACTLRACMAGNDPA